MKNSLRLKKEKKEERTWDGEEWRIISILGRTSFCPSLYQFLARPIIRRAVNDRIVVDAFLFVPVQAREVVMTDSDADESADGGDYPHLFRDGKVHTDCSTLKLIVGRHVKVMGEHVSERIVRIGTTVRVDENGHVLSQGPFPLGAGSSSDESDDDESDDNESDDDESNDSVTEFEIGHAFGMDQSSDIVRGATNYFAIVWGRAYERESGLADDEVDKEDYDFHALYYDIVVLGSNSTWSYAERDNLYESMKEDLSAIVDWDVDWE